MNYKDTITKLFNTHNSEIMNDHFKANSLLLDYVGASIYDKKLVEVIIEVYKIVDVYLLFKLKGLDGARKTLEEMYKYNAFTCSKKEFVDAINPISDLLYPDAHSNHKNNMNAVAVVKTNNTSAQSSKISLVDKDSLDIHFISGKLSIELGDDRKSFVQVNKRKVRKLEKYYDCKNKRFLFNTKDKEVVINICNTKLKNINITGNVESIDIVGNIYSKFKINNISINTVNTSHLYSSVDTNSLDVKIDGSVYFSGKISDASITTSYGYIDFYVSTISLKDVNLKLHSEYGNINGSFSDKLLPKVTSIFKKTSKLDTSSYSGNCFINILAQSDKGRIKIR